jgi:hypothetical protein
MKNWKVISAYFFPWLRLLFVLSSARFVAALKKLTIYTY